MGNEYQVDLWVSFQETSESFNTIAGTINYEELYQIIKQRMQINTPLLERLCESIIEKIRERYPFALEIRVSVYKLQAAIQNLEGRVGVTMHKKFND